MSLRKLKQNIVILKSLIQSYIKNSYRSFENQVMTKSYFEYRNDFWNSVYQKKI